MVMLAYSPAAHVVPLDWYRQMFVRMHLVDCGGKCRYCKTQLVQPGQPYPPPFGSETRQQQTEEMRLAIAHLTQERHGGEDPMHSCSECGALDYRILRALVVKAVSVEQRAVLLLPLQCSPGGVMYDLQLGAGAQRFNTLAPRDKRLGKTKCVLCNEATHVQSRATNTSVRYSAHPGGNVITMSIGSADDTRGCEVCGKLGTPAAPLKGCGVCKKTALLYCSPACSIADWPTHKRICTASKWKSAGAGVGASGSEEAGGSGNTRR